MSESRYFSQRDQKNEEKIKHMLASLPLACTIFFQGIENTTTSMTRLSYAYDLTAFFQFLAEHKKEWGNMTMQEIDMEQIARINVQDIEDFLADSRKGTEEWQNRQKKYASGDIQQRVKRKFLSVKSFFRYLCRTNRLSINPTNAIFTPKPREKEIIRLNSEEMNHLLAEVESGEGLQGREKAFHKRTQVRDSALIALMLGTGIRVSECVGLDLDDVDMKENGIHIRRKGGKESMVYFNDRVAECLKIYLEERRQITGLEPDQQEALFLSLRRQRITVRSVEKLVKKYASIITDKNITPHKLRSSYGSAIYARTNDIYLVADILGHNDVNITRKYYAAIEEERRKSVKNIKF